MSCGQRSACWIAASDGLSETSSLLWVCSEKRNLPPGSKRVRLCLTYQAVKSMFTSGGRSYSVQSHHSREEIYRACKFLYAVTCIKAHASSRSGVFVLWALLFDWLTDWLTDRTNELTRGILRKGCFLVNWGYPIVWGLYYCFCLD